MIATELPRQGNFLFRHRSYIPIVMVVPLGLALARLSTASHLSIASAWWSFTCFAISLSGLAVRGLVIGFVPRGTSGRNTREQRASVLNTTGMYSIVRHPLYLGNFLIWLGIVLDVADFAVAALFLFAYGFYYERIMAAEETYLAERFGPDYRTWAKETPAFVPRVTNWQAPALTFSVRNVLRREYCALLGITSGFAILDLVRNGLITGHWKPQPVWLLISAVGLLAFVILRWLKKHTELLRVAGR